MIKIDLVNRLWELWDALAEIGEISIDKKFIKSHTDLESEVKKLRLQNVIESKTMAWVNVTDNIPPKESNENILFITYSRIFKTGYWNGSSFVDDNGIKYSAHNEVVCWVNELDLLPPDFDEQQAIIGKRE